MVVTSLYASGPQFKPGDFVEVARYYFSQRFSNNLDPHFCDNKKMLAIISQVEKHEQPITYSISSSESDQIPTGVPEGALEASKNQQQSTENLEHKEFYCEL